MSDYSDHLKRVRKFTAGLFAPARGYSASRKPNFGQRMAVLKYVRKINELTSYEYTEYIPKRGEKTEVMTTTGQIGYKGFKKAIFPKLNYRAKIKVSFDKSRPKGSRVVLTDTRPQRKDRQYFIDALPFISAIMDADEDEDLAIEYVIDVLERYASDATFFLIRTGVFFFKGSGNGYQGDKRAVAKKIVDMMNQYSVEIFGKESSSYFGNWFAGVTGFTNSLEANGYLYEAEKNRRAYMEAHNIDLKFMYEHVRLTKSGGFAIFEGSKFVRYLRTGDDVVKNNGKKT